MVESMRLDEAVKRLHIEDDLLIKIDVQGHETSVLSGAREVLGRAKAVIIETSFMELYQYQPLFHDVYEMMVDAGYTYGGNLQQMFHPIDGRIVQADSLFLRS